jgi:hypothetical protein
MTNRFWGALCAILVASLTSCGGVPTSDSASQTAAPPASFSLVPSATQIFIMPGSSQNISLNVAGMNGFTGSVTISANGQPSTVFTSPTPLIVNSDSAGLLTFSADPTATAGAQSQVTLNGEAGSLRSTATLTVTISASPLPRLFTHLGGGILHGFYDESRRLLFATNVGLNEVDVLSGIDLRVQARIPVPQPVGIDQMADNKTLVVGSMTQTLYSVDEETYSVTPHPVPNFSYNFGSTTQALLPVALANGKVLIIGHNLFIEFASGDHLIEWDTTTGNFTEPNVPGILDGFSGLVSIARSADHKWAFGGPSFLYSSDSGTYTVGPVPNSDVRAVAVNSNGSQYAVASAKLVTFYDQHLNITATVPAASGTFQYTDIKFSHDDSKLYWQLQDVTGPGNIIDVVDTHKFVDLGNQDVEVISAPQLLWIDSKLRAFLAPISSIIYLHGGVALADLSTLSPALQIVPNYYIPNPAAIPIGSSSPVMFQNLRPDVAISFGGQASKIISDTSVTLANGYGNLSVQPPPITTNGPVDLVLTNPGGATVVEPQAFSYGLKLAASTANLLPPTGNPVIGIFGFGLTTPVCPCPDPALSVGGKAVLNLSNVSQFNNFTATSSINEYLIQVPNGLPGSAMIEAISSAGTGSLPVAYIPSAQVVPVNGLISLLYDSNRNALYALKSDEIDVFNPATMAWENPIIPLGATLTSFLSMTLTPDGSRLIVVGTGPNTLISVNPDGPSQLVSAPLPYKPLNVAVTSTGKAFISVAWDVVPAGAIEFDLATMTYTFRNDNAGSLAGRFAATPDGNEMAVAVVNGGSSAVSVWNSSNDSFLSQSFPGFFWSDLAISSDGRKIAALRSSAIAYILDERLHWLDTTVYPDHGYPDAPASVGTSFSPTGNTLIIPTQDSIEFFDANTGQLKDRLMTPEYLPGIAAPPTSSVNIAIDQTAQTIFAISASGLTVMKLPAPADQLTPGVWQ